MKINIIATMYIYDYRIIPDTNVSNNLYFVKVFTSQTVWRGFKSLKHV